MKVEAKLELTSLLGVARRRESDGEFSELLGRLVDENAQTVEGEVALPGERTVDAPADESSADAEPSLAIEHAPELANDTSVPIAGGDVMAVAEQPEATDAGSEPVAAFELRASAPTISEPRVIPEMLVTATSPVVAAQADATASHVAARAAGLASHASVPDRPVVARSNDTAPRPSSDAPTVDVLPTDAPELATTVASSQAPKIDAAPTPGTDAPAEPAPKRDATPNRTDPIPHSPRVAARPSEEIAKSDAPTPSGGFPSAGAIDLDVIVRELGSTASAPVATIDVDALAPPPAPVSDARPIAPALDTAPATTSTTTPVVDDTLAPRTADPEVVERVERVREALERLRPIPDGGVAVDVDLDGLGRVELRVEPIEGGVRVSLGTDEPSALARLEAHRAELEQALRGQGETLTLDLHAHGRRARTPRPIVPQPQQEHAPRSADPIEPRRAGRGLVDVVA